METVPAKKSTRFFKYHLPLILYSAMIIGLSSLPWLRTPKIKHFSIDKVAHFIEYAILAATTFWSFSHIQRLTRRKALLWSLLFVVAFAMLDETFQKIVPNRDSSIYDLMADISGAVLVIFFLWIRQRRSGT
jgi:VanZ family protein